MSVIKLVISDADSGLEVTRKAMLSSVPLVALSVLSPAERSSLCSALGDEERRHGRYLRYFQRSKPRSFRRFAGPNGTGRC